MLLVATLSLVAGSQILPGLPVTPAHATATFIVKSTGDAPDTAPGDGACVTAGGPCTLRAAIQEANALAGSDTINFDIGAGVPSIALGSPLPTITGQVVIEGATGGATRVEINGAGAGILANGFTVAFPSSIRHMVINRFSGNGIEVTAAASVTYASVIESYIGTDATGVFALGNGGVGVLLENGHAIVSGNVISGNALDGVDIPSSPALCAIQLASNIIGLNAAGTAGVGNGGAGVVNDADPCDFAVVRENVISGNAGDGIRASALVDSMQISCNIIGLNAAGTALISNGAHGINMGGDSNVIGPGILPCVVVRPNVIAGHATDQIFLGTLSNDNVIKGNYIGTDITGYVGLGIGGTGVVDTGTNNDIGGYLSGEGNVISGNAGGGIRLGGATTLTTIAGNKIGVGADGVTAIGNGVGGPGFGAGMYVQGSNVTTSGNVIADNLGDGIRSNVGTGNSFADNSFFGNSGLGINLMGGAGPDANDLGDGDSGPNNLQNYPVISSAKTSATWSAIKGTINSTPSTQFIVVLYSNTLCDPSGFGEGRTQAGDFGVTTDGAGNASFEYAQPTPLVAGEVLTALAIEAATQNTSEFSACATIASCAVGDDDCDAFIDVAPTSHQSPANTNLAKDNCPSYFNSSQINNDGNFFDNSPPYAVAADDKTNVNSDALGNDCDPDNDNDGLNDGAELFGGCGTSTGSLNPLNADTDGDRVTDGAECVLGSDPFLASSKPAIPSAANDPDHDQLSTAFETSIGTNPNNNDTDGDGLQDGWEYKGHGSDPTKTDTDVDGVTDGCEVASLNGDSTVNSGDQGLLGAEITRAVPPSAKLPNFDLNKDGTINSGDQGIQSTKVGPGKCPAVIPWP
jgi:CSLREA domain-containing protein